MTARPAATPGKGGPVTIGIKFDQPGLGLQEGTNYTGFDVEVAKYVAKELGYTDVTFKESPSAQRETLLQSGQVKMIFATYSITDDRKNKVSFGGPYFVAGQDLLVKSDNTDITGPDSLDGKKLCSVTGSTSAEKVKEKYATGVQLQEYDTYSKCVEALNSGSIDAVTTDNVILAGFAAQPQYQGKLKVVGKPFSTENYGVGIKKGDTALCKRQRARSRRWSPTARGRRRSTPPSGLRLQARRHDQPAQAGGLLLARTVRPAPVRGGHRPWTFDRGGAVSGLGTLFAEYDVLAAFWMTIKLTALSAVGALVIGTVVAVCGCPRWRCCGRSGRRT